MASRRGDTFDKRQRERRRQEKAAVKRARREGKEAPGPTRPAGPPVASMAAENGELMEMFAVLSQHHAAGGIDDATFAARRREIFEQMGMDVPEDGLGESSDSDDDGEPEAAAS